MQFRFNYDRVNTLDDQQKKELIMLVLNTVSHLRDLKSLIIDVEGSWLHPDSIADDILASLQVYRTRNTSVHVLESKHF